MLTSFALSFLLTAAPGSPALATGFATPEPGMLEELRRRHRPGQVLRVTSGPQRFECRAEDLGPHGLEGVTAHGRSSLPSGPLSWSGVERIDILTSRRTYGRFTGAILVGLGALLLPAISNGYSTDPPPPLRDYFFTGALVGGFVGGYLGSRVTRERPLYVAQVMPAPRATAQDAPPPPSNASSETTAPVPPGVTAADTTRPPAITATPAPSPFDAGAAGPEVQRAIRRIDSGRLLRIEGAFGRFHGYASEVSSGGLSGLRAEPSLESVSGLRALGWRDIDRVDMRAGSASQGALKGGLALGASVGVLGALLGMAVDSYGGGQGGAGPAFAGGAIGFGVGGAVGALLGSVFGSGVPSWHNVYRRP